MSTERVEKTWQRQGLKDYSTGAILGTLGHYGVTVTEEEFRKLAGTGYPMAIGTGWSQAWKGTGPFKPFPFAAAQELWRRWMTDRLAPHELSEAVAACMGSLLALLNGAPQAAAGSALEKVNAVRARMPMDAEGVPQQAFVEEALGVFDERFVEQFDGLAEALAERGHAAEGEAFADLEEFLLPERRGVSKAIVRAAKGEKEGAIGDLEKLAADTSRSPLSRLLGVDGLIHLKANAQAAATGRALLTEAEKSEDLHLALDLVPRLEHVYKALGDRAALQALAQDAARLEAAHDHAHPGHHRH
ncbi:hypothetical protein P2318_07140 [Myxococcaceae bacterium GXIMD 01537]